LFNFNQKRWLIAPHNEANNSNLHISPRRSLFSLVPQFDDLFHFIAQLVKYVRAQVDLPPKLDHDTVPGTKRLCKV
jgi:hypothetical protein